MFKSNLISPDDVGDEGIVAVLLGGAGGDVAEVMDVAGRLVEESVGHVAAAVHVELDIKYTRLGFRIQCRYNLDI